MDAILLAGGYGTRVVLDRATPAQLRAYPLIVTRRNPAAPPPPAAYRLAWQGTYYAVWERSQGATLALGHVVPSSDPGARCDQLARLARRGARLVVALSPALVRVDLARVAHPARWGHERSGLVIERGGALSAPFVLPHAGGWEVWLEGQFMPSIELAVDGARVGSIGGQLAGNSLVPDTAAPLALHLAAGAHRLTLRRGGFTLAPGNGGAAVLDGIVLAAAGTRARRTRMIDSPAAARAMCGEPLAWVESLPLAPRA